MSSKSDTNVDGNGSCNHDCTNIMVVAAAAAEAAAVLAVVDSEKAVLALVAVMVLVRKGHTGMQHTIT